jgi:hypothetical protein
MRNPLPSPAEAYTPDANRAGQGSPTRSPERFVHWLALLILFLQQPWNCVRLLRSGQLALLWQDRPDLPAGSTQAEAAAIRGQFGNAIAWMCRRHGVGPGHPDWPYLSRTIETFGGSLARFRAGAPACGLQWWENPNIVPGIVPGFGAPAAATASLVQPQAVAGALPPAPTPNARQTEAAHARSPASWLAASGRQIFARAGPGPSTGPPRRPGLPISFMSNARGQSMAGPAVLIRAN